MLTVVVILVDGRVGHGDYDHGIGTDCGDRLILAMTIIMIMMVMKIAALSWG